MSVWQEMEEECSRQVGEKIMVEKVLHPILLKRTWNGKSRAEKGTESAPRWPCRHCGGKIKLREYSWIGHEREFYAQCGQCEQEYTTGGLGI